MRRSKAISEFICFMAAEAWGDFGGIILSTINADGMGKAYLGLFCLDDRDITGRTEHSQTA
jgi:hypothetical protein